MTRLSQWTLIRALVRNVLFLLEAEIKTHAIQLDIHLSKNQLLVLGDSVEIEQVIFNLIQNALDKLDTEDKSPHSIVLSTARVENQTLVSVVDDGFQIDDSMLDRIFEPFVSTKKDGMGLGLALCERIVNRLNGQIELYNVPVGVKARFTLPAI